MSREKRLEELERYMRVVSSDMVKAAFRGIFDGTRTYKMQTYMQKCYRDDERTGTVLIFMREQGYHSSGWFKNPEYERCFHLSLSPGQGKIIDVVPNRLAESDWKTWQKWVSAFFGNDVKYVWTEGPQSNAGKARNVWHFRIMCDMHWQPIIPKGEVYSMEFTEHGWKSASQLFAENVKDE